MYINLFHFLAVLFNIIKLVGSVKLYIVKKHYRSRIIKVMH